MEQESKQKSQTSSGKIRKATVFRWIIRTLIFAGIVYLAWPRSDVADVAGILPKISPWVALCRIAGRSIALSMIVPGIFLLVFLFVPRFYCRFICPVGFVYDLLTIKRRPWKWMAKFPNLGPWIVGIGIGAAACGYPLLLWMDPLVIANAGISLTREGTLTSWEWVAGLAGPVFLLLLTLLLPSLWRTKICPLGATQDLVYRFSKWIRHPIQSFKTKPEISSSKISRRFWMGLGIAAVYRLAFPPKPNEEKKNEPIRPPATPPEEIFIRKCARCGACARACPNGIIRFGGAGRGFASLLSPELDFENNFCHPECTVCSKVCPTGAIPAFNLYNKFERPIGLAVVEKDLCQLTSSRECGFCSNSCPHGALEVVGDMVIVKPEVCVGCGACEYSCPVLPKAIHVVARREFPHED